MKKLLLATATLLSSFLHLDAQVLKPYGSLPSEAQLKWQQLEYYMFIHFGVNTFTDKEWGHGDESPKVFNPTQLDARQWARTAKLAGMKGIIITAKHHDGFCLWPSAYSTHTVRESAWKNGKGDVLAELSAACKEYGLKFGVYLSPWDRNHPAYGTPGYNEIFAKTLEEVHTKYGDVFEQWFDGANGEGPNGKKQVYDWDLFHKVVYKYHPNAIIFSDNGPGCRWIGNEKGFAGETNWSTINADKLAPGMHGINEILNNGLEDGKDWVPGEADVSIRPGWFYSPATDDKVKSVQDLMQIYYASVGRNANLLLNVPVDRRGLIPRGDSIRLMEFKRARDAAFKNNIALKLRATATSTRVGKNVSAIYLTDGSAQTYWAASDAVKQPVLYLSSYKPFTFNRLVLQEHIALGQRVKSFKVEALVNHVYEEIASGTTIGHKRILILPTTTTNKLKITFLDSKAAPVINELQLYLAPVILSDPKIQRNQQGLVNIEDANKETLVRYTLDGREPTAQSKVYSAPFAFIQGGTVKAKAFTKTGVARSGNTVTAKFDLAPVKWKVIGSSDEILGNEAAKAIDGQLNTAWRTNWKTTNKGYPHEISVDLGETVTVKGFKYYPNRDDKGSGNVYEYAFYLSQDGKNWGAPVAKGQFGNIANNPVLQTVQLNVPRQAKFFKFEAISPAHENEHWVTIPEINLITK
ncbi:alpha-L-fucosidase [Chitinophaga caeni]|uniref:alpha-L-fucosidase n=1 Tax=Chitinophaga caeni TaxID=2029983 RepID=A0A291R041_9BACT|nr:alpha-L-fucosidase [Chitinophaga caeni]ATL49545.1 alpha-L-fucosidase [Chitinophaga caeni]